MGLTTVRISGRISSRIWFLGSILLACQLFTTATGATLVVTSNADSGPGTLRAAIAAAGNNDIIKFALSFPTTIALTNGELLIPGNLSIAGPGAADLTISGDNGSRVFHIGSSNNVTI